MQIDKMICHIFTFLVSTVFCCNAAPQLGLGLGLGSAGLGLESLGLGLGPYGVGLGNLGLGSLGGLGYNGPCPSPLPVLPAPPVCLSGAPSPIIELPAPPPPPTQVLDNKCICTKTVVKPQFCQRVVNVPSVNRFLKKSYVPVVENIPYTANACGSCGSCGSFGPCGSCGSCGCAGLGVDNLFGSCGLPCGLNSPLGLNLPGYNTGFPF